MLRCAIYARVSDESQVRGDSIDHQISFCREIARRRGLDDGEEWLLPENLVFVDAGVTGTSLVKREAVQKLIREAKKKSFDVVLFKGISRFARDTVDALLMLRTLVASGVRVISIEENFDSYRDSAEFVFTIHSALAQAESEKTAVRVRMGAAQKAKQGKWNGQAPEGYLLNTETQRLEPDFPYARLIQEIFALYLRGYGVRKIASSLNERGRRTRKGNLWSQRTISRILRNPVYVGDVVYGRRERRLAAPTHEDGLASRKRTVWVENPDDVIVFPNAHPSLVDRTVFESVQAVMATKRQATGRSGGLHLLSRGIAKCQCGSSLTVRYNTVGTRYYRCVAQSDKGRSFCQQPFLRADELESLVLTQFREDALKRFSFEVPTVVYGNPSPMERELRETEEIQKKLIRSSQLLFEQFAEGYVSKEQFTTINDDYRARIGVLSQRREKLLEFKNEASWRECNESTLRAAFAQFVSPRSEDLELTRQLLETCIENITVTNFNVTIQYRFAKSD